MGGVLIEWAPSYLIEGAGVPEEDAGILIKELFKEVEWLELDAGTMNEKEVFEAIGHSRRIAPQDLSAASQRHRHSTQRNPRLRRLVGMIQR